MRGRLLRWPAPAGLEICLISQARLRPADAAICVEVFVPTTTCRFARREKLTPGSQIVMRPGTIKRIHVNQHMIRHNKKTGEKNNVITIQWRNKSYPVRTLQIRGLSETIYSPDKPLSCGAHVWVETKAEVVATC